ncbi:MULTISPECIES: type I restriction endonuclease subunit R [unclassified Archaeoglobus]|jgi:type I restriction enzyme R subunit|uniref:type I restriction endonuclease subunit R n=1 Tax=unclassified Archaeoglobus TaxID=2643606 RepID=UPI0025C1423A|nr:MULTISPECIES: HsdR family type I site-specific deoxyribonuclease [unclassified Archaeoglobus]
MSAQLTEEYMVENHAINALRSLGYEYIHGSNLTPDNGERESYRDVILKNRFINAIKRLNPWLDDDHAENVYQLVSNIDHPDPVMRGKMFYDMLTSGVKFTFKENGEERTRLVKLVDFSNPKNNEFLAANQFEVEYYYEHGRFRIPDLVVFINGIPLAIFEFKGFNSGNTAKDAFNDHKTKMNDIPQLYQYAQILVVSDGLETKYGSPTSDWERFFVWEGIESDDDVEVLEFEDDSGKYAIYRWRGKELTSLDVLLLGLFNKERFLEFIEDFIIYDKSGKKLIKIIATYYQFYTVKKAVERTTQAVIYGRNPEERRIGVVWHTQGSGKSLTMLFYAKKVIKIPELDYPLLIFLTDRRELDEQLYGVFANVFPIAKHVETIEDLHNTVRETRGGIIFATIQKFGRKSKEEEYPLLTERKNIVIIADEAHRSHYRQLAENLRRAIPNASFLGFTATPVDYEDRSTTLVFGNYISVYSIEKARRHGIVVPIYYESRLSELHLTNEFIDLEFEEISERVTADPEEKESIKRAFAKLERIMLTDKYIQSVAKDIVEHFNKRLEEFDGKAMVVTISRKVAVELYKKIIEQPNSPNIAVVMSGSKSKDPEEFHEHIRTGKQLKELADKFKDPESDLKMVIVVDMWLAGFDVPCLHTMYFWKPMKNHSLVQAIARVNRVFKDKPGGLIVDYIGIADNLRKSLSKYALEQIKETLTNINEVLALLKEKHDILCSYFAGLNFRKWKEMKPEELSRLTAQAYERVARDEETKKRFVKNFVALKKLYLLASPHPDAIAVKDDLAFFEMIKKMIVKYSVRKKREISRELEGEITKLISKSIVAKEPIDVFDLLKKEKPEISLLSEEFLKELENLEYRSLAVDLLLKILHDRIRVKMRINPWKFKSLYKMLNELIEKHNTKIIEVSEMISRLVEIAREVRRAEEEGKQLNMSDEEYAFYSLLLSYPNLPIRDRERIEEIARELANHLSGYVKISEWKRKEYMKARIKAEVKRILMKKGIKDYSVINELSKLIVDHAAVMS